jgi:hypothetical protein
VTCAPHVAGFPASSTSTIERWVMNRVGNVSPRRRASAPPRIRSGPGRPAG